MGRPAAPGEADAKALAAAAASPGSAAWLSALVDGEADAHDAEAACRAWRSDAATRATWHRYQLIGDALRSDELVTSPDHDAAFLARLRTRLADEPVPLAPTPLDAPVVPASPDAAAAAAPRRRHVWLTSAAVAAGFVAVAGVLVVTRLAPGAGDGPLLAWGWGGGAGAAGGAVPASATMLRDAGLDRYLEAHRGLPGVAPSVPGGGLRPAEAVVTLPPAAGDRGARASAASR